MKRTLNKISLKKHFPCFTREATYVWRNSEVLSCKHCCSGKAISFTHSVCVCVCPYLLSMQWACTLLCCHLWLVFLCYILPHYLTHGNIFGKKVIEHKMCFFKFCVKLLSKTSLIVRRVQPHIKNAHVKYSSFLSYFHGTCNFWSDFRKSTQILYFMNIRAVGAE
jgi:hypothetical protein